MLYGCAATIVLATLKRVDGRVSMGVFNRLSYAQHILLQLPAFPREQGLPRRVAEVSRNVRVLPGPLELKRSQFGWETVHDHLHDPWSVLGRLPRTLRDLPIMLTW